MAVDWQLQDFWSWQVKKIPLFCQKCRGMLLRIDQNRACHGCGCADKQGYCSDCARWQLSTQFKVRNRALYQYNAAMKQYIKRYKFMGGYHLRGAFRGEMQAAIKKLDMQLVVPIPSAATTLAQRGYNQVTVWLQGMDYQAVLACRVNKQQQAQKNRIARLKSSQPFYILETWQSLIPGQRICLVDDIYTTGATIHHAAQLLYQAGALEVQAVTLAHG